jgi:hypothetical protein
MIREFSVPTNDKKNHFFWLNVGKRRLRILYYFNLFFFVIMSVKILQQIRSLIFCPSFFSYFLHRKPKWYGSRTSYISPHPTFLMLPYFFLPSFCCSNLMVYTYFFDSSEFFLKSFRNSYKPEGLVFIE